MLCHLTVIQARLTVDKEVREYTHSLRQQHRLSASLSLLIEDIQKEEESKNIGESLGNLGNEFHE